MTAISNVTLLYWSYLRLYHNKLNVTDVFLTHLFFITGTWRNPVKKKKLGMKTITVSPKSKPKIKTRVSKNKTGPKLKVKSKKKPIKPTGKG